MRENQLNYRTITLQQKSLSCQRALCFHHYRYWRTELAVWNLLKTRPKTNFFGAILQYLHLVCHPRVLKEK